MLMKWAQPGQKTEVGMEEESEGRDQKAGVCMDVWGCVCRGMCMCVCACGEFDFFLDFYLSGNS